MTTLPAPSLGHLERLSDDVGIIEHARYSQPRGDVGYCTDDAGRLLAVACGLAADPAAHRLAAVALRFLSRAHDGGTGFRLRLGPDRRWRDDPPSDDATGRALFGLGTAAASAPWPEVRDVARNLFGRAAGFRSPYPRATAYAALGAVAVLGVAPKDHSATELLADAAAVLPRARGDPEWPWPEPRLSYANAVIPEALIAVGDALGEHEIFQAGLALLGWLCAVERRSSWFSFTPVGGRGPGDHKPAFDQQPIEAWSLASACDRALVVTGELHWGREVLRAADWFCGANDLGAVMFDAKTGGGYDGLGASRANRNEGAESTLAFVATMREARLALRWVQAHASSLASASSRRGTDATAAPTWRSAAP
ncbi:MAG: glycosyltransferase [Actinomycetota bacterium]|nr:glycosyltransferase [Actinomycetota bacterium]